MIIFLLFSVIVSFLIFFLENVLFELWRKTRNKGFKYIDNYDRLEKSKIDWKNQHDYCQFCSAAPGELHWRAKVNFELIPNRSQSFPILSIPFPGQ